MYVLPQYTKQNTKPWDWKGWPKECVRKEKKSLRTEPWGAPSVWNHCGSKNCTDCDPQYEKHFPSWLLTWTRGHTHETEISQKNTYFPYMLYFLIFSLLFHSLFFTKKKSVCQTRKKEKRINIKAKEINNLQWERRAWIDIGDERGKK